MAGAAPSAARPLQEVEPGEGLQPRLGIGVGQLSPEHACSCKAAHNSWWASSSMGGAIAQGLKCTLNSREKVVHMKAGVYAGIAAAAISAYSSAALAYSPAETRPRMPAWIV